MTDLASIKSDLGIEDAELRISDNAGFIWLNITRDGKSWSYRLPLDPKPHHIEDAKEAAEQWWKEERE